MCGKNLDYSMDTKHCKLSKVLFSIYSVSLDFSG